MTITITYRARDSRHEYTRTRIFDSAFNASQFLRDIDTGTATIASDNVDTFLAQEPTVDSLLQFVVVK